MRQKLISIGEDYTIEDESGHAVYRVDGKVLRIRETFVLEDMAGHEAATIREKKLAIRDSMKILRGGETIATVKKALISPFTDRFDVEVEGGEDLKVKGDLLDHDYEIRRGGDVIAQVSKRWFTLRDTFGIDIAEGEDDALILAIAVALDDMVDNHKNDD